MKGDLIGLSFFFLLLLRFIFAIAVINKRADFIIRYGRLTESANERKFIT